MASRKRASLKQAETSSLGSVAPQPGEGKRGEEGHIGYLLRQAGAAYRLRLERALIDLKITPPQFAVLTMLKAYPGVSSADVARIALLTPPTVSVILGNLVRDKLAVRRAHKTHGRIQEVRLTSEGNKVLAKGRLRAEAIEEDLLAGLSQSEEELIKRWLVRIATASEL